MKPLLYTLFFILLLASCNNSQKRSSTTFAQEEQVTDSFALFTKNVEFPIDSFTPGSPKLSVDLKMHYIVSSDKERELAINNAIVEHVFGYKNLEPQTAMDSFTNYMKEEYMQLKDEYYNEKSINGGGEWFNYNYDIVSEITNGRKNTINYTIHNVSYTGGPHGSEFYTFLNFDSKSGKEIKLNDIFKDNYYEALTDRLTVALAKQKNAKSLEKLQEMGYLILNDMYPTDNFLLKTDSIIFHYNRYDIAPYALGETRISFSYDELKDLLRE